MRRHAKAIVAVSALLLLTLALGVMTAAAAAEGGCSNEAVRDQQNSGYLPECRAYELVSPADKNSSYVQNTLQVDDEGGAIAWASLGAYAGTPGIDVEAPYVARRTGPGTWATTSFFPRFGETYRPGFMGFNGGYTFSDDLRKMAFVTFGSFDPQDHDAELSPYGAFTYWDIYLSTGDGSAQWLSHGTEGIGPNEPIHAEVKGISRDGSTVFFLTEEALSPEVTAKSGVRQLYRWREGNVELVGRDENGALLSGGSWLGVNATFAYTINGDAGRLPDAEGISPDGKAFVYGGVSGGPAAPAQLYLHEADGNVVRISSSQRTGSVGEPASSGASFITGVSDFGILYFRSADQLTDDAPAGGGDYAYDVASGELTYSNPDPTVSGGQGGFVRVSDDGRYVYFASSLALAPGAAEESGRLNLYVKGPDGLKYISPASTGDLIYLAANPLAPLRTQTGLSGDGTKLVYLTTAQATDYDTNGTPQVYLYDASTEQVTCVSCNQSAPSSTGAASFGSSEYALDTPRVITADGSTVAFASTEQLVPGDTNNTRDVYTFSDGHLHLISDGASTSDATFAGMSRDGTDLFFKTRSSLVRADFDKQLFDMYDARVGGGALEPLPALPCSGDSCQAGAPPAPAAAVPGSRTVNGPGNATPRKHGKHRKKHHGKKRHAHKGGKSHSGKHRQGSGRRVRPVNHNQGGVR